MKLTTLGLGTVAMSQQLAESLDRPLLTLAMTTEEARRPCVLLLDIVAMYALLSPWVPE
jgi:hypothetical protein